MSTFRRIACALALFPTLLGVAHAAPPTATPPAAPVGFPQDAGPHDATSAIEWWYFNTFLTTEKGHHYAVIGAFFRTGIAPTQKGQYLIYALADLDAKSREPFALIDRTEVDLLKAYLSLYSLTQPNDARTKQLLPMLRQGKFPPPLRLTEQNAVVETSPLFSVAMDNDSFSQESADGRTWKAALNGADWTLDLTLDQPATSDRPPMLVDGNGLTGLKRPDDMHYVSLTRMSATGTLTDGGVVDKVTGVGWLDRQWGTSWVVQDNGWDWFGLHLDDGSELIVYRVRDNKTGKVLRADATLLDKNGIQTCRVRSRFSLPDTGSGYTDPETHINIPAIVDDRPAQDWSDGDGEKRVSRADDAGHRYRAMRFGRVSSMSQRHARQAARRLVGAATWSWSATIPPRNGQSAATPTAPVVGATPPATP